MRRLARLLVVASSALLLGIAGCQDDEGNGSGGGGSCGPEPAAAECRLLCEEACGALVACGMDQARCTSACFERYACPGESPDHDAVICRQDRSTLTADCPGLCTWAEGFGECTTGKSWQSFGVERVTGPCPPGQTCRSVWLVRPDGDLEKWIDGESSEAKLSAEHLAALDGILTSRPFQDAMASGFACGEPPTDIGVTFSLRAGSGSHEQDVTGCVVGASGASPAKDAYAIVTAY